MVIVTVNGGWGQQSPTGPPDGPGGPEGCPGAAEIDGPRDGPALEEETEAELLLLDDDDDDDDSDPDPDLRLQHGCSTA